MYFYYTYFPCFVAAVSRLFPGNLAYCMYILVTGQGELWNIMYIQHIGQIRWNLYHRVELERTEYLSLQCV